MQGQVSWQRGVLILTGIYITRLLGMFILFPVFSLYAQGLTGASAATIGFALGAYGLTQGLFQIPFGWLSDKFGRKLPMLLGLAIFAVGTAMAAMADDINAMILARLVQGMGAVSAVTLAYATDITPVEVRGKSMRIIGASIGLTFVVALILAPLLDSVMGTRGIFWLIFGLVLLSMLGTFKLPPVPAQPQSALVTDFNGKALYLPCIGIFLLHVVFTGAFVLIPTLLHQSALPHLWAHYLIANVVATALMRPRNQPHALNFGVNYLVLAVGLALYLPASGFWGFLLAASVFFIAFYRLETALPHYVSLVANEQQRGKAMGYYATCQFFGSFFGGALAGALWRHSSLPLTLMILALLAGATGLGFLAYSRKFLPKAL